MAVGWFTRSGPLEWGFVRNSRVHGGLHCNAGRLRLLSPDRAGLVQRACPRFHPIRSTGHLPRHVCKHVHGTPSRELKRIRTAFKV